MTEVAKIDAGFFKRGKTYQIRRVVPRDLRPLLKRNEIVKSLKTGDETEAARRYHVESAKIDEYFEEQRRLTKPVVEAPEFPTTVRAVTALTPQHIRTQVIEEDLMERDRLFRAAEEDPARFWRGDLIEIPDTEYATHLLGNGDLDPFLSYCMR